MLIGLPASRIGSADPLLSKSLCLHLPSLMYPLDSTVDLDISPYVQTAALVGLGLLHCSSPNRLIIEYLLTELSSPRITLGQGDGNQETKEAIALSAGWSLGMLLLCLGRFKSDPANLDIHDLRVEDRLQQCIDGGLKSSESHLFTVRMIFVVAPQLSLFGRIRVALSSLLMRQRAPGKTARFFLSHPVVLLLECSRGIISIRMSPPLGQS
jgi:hypothetical protein